MGKPKNEQTGDLGVEQLNRGVNYMENKPVENVQQPVMEQPVAAQPVVNTAVVKEKATMVVGKAKGAVDNYTTNIKTNKKYQIGTIVVVVVVLLLLFGKMLSPAYRVVNSYMGGMKKFNAEKIVKLMHKDMYEDDDDEIDSLEETFEYMEDEEYSFKSYKIREYEKYSEDELEDLAEKLDEYYGIDEDEVKAARTYWVKAVVDVDGEKNITYNDVTVVKIKGKWYLYN